MAFSGCLCGGCAACLAFAGVTFADPDRFEEMNRIESERAEEDREATWAIQRGVERGEDRRPRGSE